MKALANGVDGGNGVYHYGPSGFPDTTFNATNYWVDASFDRTVPPDTRGPTVTETSPASNAIDLDRGTQVSASFDEPLQADVRERRNVHAAGSPAGPRYLPT